MARFKVVSKVTMHETYFIEADDKEKAEEIFYNMDRGPDYAEETEFVEDEIDSIEEV